MNDNDSKGVNLVFIAEDDEMFGQMVSLFVERNSEFKAVVFKTGEELLENLYQNPDIVILDHNLNDLDTSLMNGIDVLNKLNADRPSLPVIILSGQEQMNTAVDLIHSGACDYINKNDGTAFQQLSSTLKDVLKVKDEKIQFEQVKNNIKWVRRRLAVAAFLVVGLVTILSITGFLT